MACTFSKHVKSANVHIYTFHEVVNSWERGGWGVRASGVRRGEEVMYIYIYIYMYIIIYIYIYISATAL